MATANLRTCLFCLVTGAVCGGLVVAPTRASAQDALTQDQAERRTDLARTLFATGVEHVQAQRWAEAEVAFREALANHDAPSIRYNLASVLVEQGEYPEARLHIDAVLRDTTTSEDIRTHTTELRTQMDARAGYARFEVTGATDTTVAIDGHALEDPSVEVALAPGAHVATASRQDAELVRETIEIATGEHRTVTLAVPLPEVAAPEPVDRGSAPAEAPLTEQWWFWTAVGGGVVVVGAVIVIAVAASSGGVQAPVTGDFNPGVLRW